MSDIFSESERELIFSLAHQLTGLSESLRPELLLSNVYERMRSIDILDLRTYLIFVDENDQEFGFLLSALTVHTTSFFRESPHFAPFEAHVVSNFRGKQVRMLSAGSSTGQEAYSFGFVLEKLRRSAVIKDYVIEAWDIDPVSLANVRHANYPSSSRSQIPDWVKVDFELMKDPDGILRIPQTIVERCIAKTVNLTEVDSYPQHQFDVIVCRNVLIYFSQNDSRKVVSALVDRISDSGILLLGHSESGIADISQLNRIEASIFSKIAQAKTMAPSHGKFVNRGSFQVLSLPTLKLKDEVATTTESKVDLFLIDDEAELLKILEEELKRSGYEVMSFTSPSIAMTQVSRHRPKLVITDMKMGDMDGMQVCQRVAEIDPQIKRVIMSANADIIMAKSASHLGVSEVILKPFAFGEVKRIVERLLQEATSVSDVDDRVDLVLVGASTGGPDAVDAVLSTFGSYAPPPIAVVQHIAPDFAVAFAQAAAKKAGLKLIIPLTPVEVLPGHLYASDGSGHLILQKRRRKIFACIQGTTAVNGHIPSVDELFNSCVALRSTGIAAVLLTGMGRDGASGLLALRQMGASTFCQDEESSVVYGMPREAIALGAAKYVGSPRQINEKLVKLFIGKKNKAA